MPEVRKADPAARRQAVLTVLIGALVGALLIGGFEWYRDSLLDWLRAQASERPDRLRRLFFLSGAVLSAPLVVFAVRLWLLGETVLRARQFPPPGYRVIRDTPIVGERAAVVRGQILKILSAGLVVASAFLCFLLWRLLRVLVGGA
jgi:hypothetical protein